MSASFRLLILLAAIGAAGGWLANVTRAPSALPDQPVGSIGDARFAAAVPVRHVAFSPDGRWLAGTGRGEIRLWDAVTGRAVRRIAFDDSAVGTLVAFTPDGCDCTRRGRGGSGTSSRRTSRADRRRSPRTADTC